MMAVQIQKMVISPNETMLSSITTQPCYGVFNRNDSTPSYPNTPSPSSTYQSYYPSNLSSNHPPPPPPLSRRSSKTRSYTYTSPAPYPPSSPSSSSPSSPPHPTPVPAILRPSSSTPTSNNPHRSGTVSGTLAHSPSSCRWFRCPSLRTLASRGCTPLPGVAPPPLRWVRGWRVGALLV